MQSVHLNSRQNTGKDKHIERVGIFLYYPGSLKFHPSIVNSAKLWIKKGYKVDIFKCYHSDEGVDPNDNFNVVHTCKYQSNIVLRIISLIKFIRNYSSYARNKVYKLLIGVDAYGIIIAGLLRWLSNVPMIYFSLEILTTKFNYISLKQKNIFEKTGYILHHSITKLFERYFHKKALFTIIQDEHRWKTLKEVNKMSEGTDVIFVPNSPLKDNCDDMDDHDSIRNKYGITGNKKIVLYAGSLGEWTGVDRILDNVYSWPKNTVLIIHGRGNPAFIRKLRNNISDHYSERVILSLDQLIEKDFNLLIRSAQIGLVWYYDDKDPNVYTIGAASGKLFYYLKYGLPVVAKRWPGLIEIVVGNDCGVCVDSEKDIGSSLVRIIENYESYSNNAKRCFKQYEFSRHYELVIDKFRRVSP